MLPKTWLPQPLTDPVRIGGTHDGGYVLSRGALEEATLLVSMGLESNWEFEKEFIDRTGGRVLCCDHTVTRRWWVNYTIDMALRRRWRDLVKYFQYRRFFGRPEAEHRRVKIGYDGPHSTSLDSIMAEVSDEHVLLKVDIEGWEYRILDQIVSHQNRFTAVVIEFHDLDLHRDRVTAFLAALDSLSVIWIHGNNYGDIDPGGDPIVVEMTLARASAHATTEAGPAVGTSDRPNNPHAPEIELTFASE